MRTSPLPAYRPSRLECSIPQANSTAFSSSLAGTVPRYACETSSRGRYRRAEVMKQSDGRTRAGLSRSLRSPVKSNMSTQPLSHCLNTTYRVETDRPCPRHVPNTNDQVSILKSEEEWAREKEEGQESSLCRTKTGLPAVYNNTSATRSWLRTHLYETYVQTVWCRNTLGNLYIEQEAIKTSSSRFLEKISGLEP